MFPNLSTASIQDMSRLPLVACASFASLLVLDENFLLLEVAVVTYTFVFF